MPGRMGLASVIAHHAQQSPDKTALHFAGQDISYGQLWQGIDAVTANLVHQGIQPGDRVAWLGLNDPAQLVLLLALARVGAILLPLNYRLAPAELLAILLHAQAGHVVAEDTHALVAQALASKAHVKVLAANQLHGSHRHHTSVQLEPVETIWPWHKLGASGGGMGDWGDRGDQGDAASPVLLVYTSGTTGLPKGALHTQAGLAANCLASVAAHDLTANDHVLTVLPLFHVGGLCIQTLPALYVGAQVTLHARFDAGAWLADVQRLRPTTSVLVPATLRAVIDHPTFKTTDVSSLRLLNAGSSTIPLSQIEAFHVRGVPVCQVYGATETGPVSICLKAQDAMRLPGSAGQGGLNVQVRLVDKQGADARPGDVGEIWLRAPNLMARYWRDDDNPAFQDGWFHSGDLARCDSDGFYWVAGRSKDMIISGGENIYPAEIENQLADCAAILEATVVGLPDDQWGEIAAAVIVKQPGAALDAAAVLAWLDGKIARFKLPRRIEFVDALPKTALGKVVKAQVVSALLNRAR